MYEHREIVKLLLDRGADPKTKNKVRLQQMNQELMGMKVCVVIVWNNSFD